MKNLYTHANDYLEGLEFSKKTKLLIGIIVLGMASIGFFMLVSIFSIKYDYESLYQRHTLSQVALEKIKDLYSVNIHDTLDGIRHNEIKPNDAAEVIGSAVEIVQAEWRKYQRSSQYHIGGAPWLANRWLHLFFPDESIPSKSYYQESLFSKVQKKVQTINARSLAIVPSAKKQRVSERDKKIHDLFLDIDSINIYLSSLITSQLKEAVTEKRRNDRIFHGSIIMMSVLIGLVFFLSILISLTIINHIKRLNDSLESKVLDKTRELRTLNTSLEKRITKEVENSRKKDHVLFQQAKLASMGEMLQNIAHQWRQPLGALTMIIQSFETKFLSGKLTQELIESKVSDAMLISKNMSDTLEDFRTFFHPHKIHRRFSLREAIQKAIDLTKYQLTKEKISLEFQMSDTIIIRSYENELTHVMLNLINNSCDALISAPVEHKKILIIVKQSSHHIDINVVDNAGGIKDDIMPKIFEPYFTTKHKSVGTGIGLYMSRQIVEKHLSGTIRAKNIRHTMGSKQGTLHPCTMFTIRLPKQPTTQGVIDDKTGL